MKSSVSCHVGVAAQTACALLVGVTVGCWGASHASRGRDAIAFSEMLESSIAGHLLQAEAIRGQECDKALKHIDMVLCTDGNLLVSSRRGAANVDSSEELSRLVDYLRRNQVLTEHKWSRAFSRLNELVEESSRDVDVKGERPQQ